MSALNLAVDPLPITLLAKCLDGVLNNEYGDTFRLPFLNMETICLGSSDQNADLTYYKVRSRLMAKDHVIVNPIKMEDISNVVSTVLQNENTNRIILPVGVNSQLFYFIPHNHMITVVIDLLNSETTNVYIIDSKKFTFIPYKPDITNKINAIAELQSSDIKFIHHFIAHQGPFDNKTCCYFTLKVIWHLLRYIDIPTEECLNKIPRSPYWVWTNLSWITADDILAIYRSVGGGHLLLSQ